MKKYYYFIFLLILIPLNVIAKSCVGYNLNGQYYDKALSIVGSAKPTYGLTKISEQNKNFSNGTVLAVVEEQSCTSLLGSPSENYTPAFYLSKAFHVLKYAGIVILIVMSVVDFTTALASNDNDAIAKAAKKTTIRLVFCVIIFLLPYLIELILKYLNDRAIDMCGIG